MLTRRSAIFGAALLAGVSPAVAARPPHLKGTKAEPAPPETPASTPLGPVDTAARWAFAMDFNTGAELLEQGGRRGDAAVVDDQADDALHRLFPPEGRPDETRRHAAGIGARLAHGRVEDVRPGRRRR